MARPRTPIGTFGEIRFEQQGNGRIRALVRFRDHDGRLRRVTATGDTQKAAERNLKEVLSDRVEQSTGTGELTASSSFGQLVEVWLDDLDLENKLAESTRALYERNMRQLVLPAFENYTLREISVRKVDQFVKTRTGSGLPPRRYHRGVRQRAQGRRGHPRLWTRPLGDVRGDEGGCPPRIPAFRSGRIRRFFRRVHI
jgi:hypothetical protein